MSRVAVPGPAAQHPVASVIAIGIARPFPYIANEIEHTLLARAAPIRVGRRRHRIAVAVVAAAAHIAPVIGPAAVDRRIAPWESRPLGAARRPLIFFFRGEPQPIMGAE